MAVVGNLRINDVYHSVVVQVSSKSPRLVNDNGFLVGMSRMRQEIRNRGLNRRISNNVLIAHKSSGEADENKRLSHYIYYKGIGVGMLVVFRGIAVAVAKVLLFSLSATPLAAGSK